MTTASSSSSSSSSSLLLCSRKGLLLLQALATTASLCGSSGSSGGGSTTLAFVLPSPSIHRRRIPTTTFLRDYVNPEESGSHPYHHHANNDDYASAYEAPPLDVRARVHPDARIKEWQRPPPPNYHHHHHNNNNPHRNPHPQRQPPPPPPPPANHNAWSHYMTVSDESVANPDELRTRLSPTAPHQPDTPSPEEFMFAEIKDLVFNYDPHAAPRDMAAPDRFDAYMTVSESHAAPPPLFVDAEIVVEQEDDVENDDDLDNVVDDGSVEDVVFNIDTEPPPPPTHVALDLPNELVESIHHVEPTLDHHDNPHHQDNNNDDDDDDPLHMFEQNFPESPVTMKQLAEDYRRREALQQQLEYEQYEAYHGRSPQQQQQQHHQHQVPYFAASNTPPPVYHETTDTLEALAMEWEQQQQQQQPGPCLDRPFYPEDTSSSSLYHQPIPMPDMNDLAREWINGQGSSSNIHAAMEPNNASDDASMEDLAEAWVRMTCQEHE